MGDQFEEIIVEYGLKKKLYVHVYVFILIIGSVVSSICHIDNHDPFQNQEPIDGYLPSWLQPGNLFNFIFTDLMPLWYIIGVTLIAACVQFGSQVSVDTEETRATYWKKLLKRLLQVFGSWVLFIGLKKVVSSFVHFNISGHFMTLTSASTSLMLEYLLLYETANDSVPKSLSILTKLYITMVLLIWFFILLVTSVFYHTFLEKLFGQGCAFLSSYCIYSTNFGFSSELQDEISIV